MGMVKKKDIMDVDDIQLRQLCEALLRAFPNDGYVVIYQPSNPIWSTNTVQL